MLIGRWKRREELKVVSRIYTGIYKANIGVEVVFVDIDKNEEERENFGIRGDEKVGGWWNTNYDEVESI